MEEFSEEIDMNDLASIDDFIKELEAREKDLHISSESVIEIEDSAYDEPIVAEMPQSEQVALPMVEPDSVSEVVITEKVPPQNPVRIAEIENEVEGLRKKALKLEAEKTELFELSRRRQTDFDNYKNRTERERKATLSNQLGDLAIHLLPVLDNLDRALGSASDPEDGKHSDFRQFYDGIVLVNKQLNEVLKEIGVRPIPSVGESFDPHFHEAVATEENDEQPVNTILSELLRGYQLGDKVIRASMVTVSTASASVTEKPASDG